MDSIISEKIFESYLKSKSMIFERNFRVFGEKNVDFKINQPEGTVLCDVKEVRDSRVGSMGNIDAYTHIREDIKDLRKKFGRKKPTFPVVLVTMNFSNKFFTGLTVACAMLGDIGAEFSVKGRGEIHHLPRGNASMTKTTNTSISGVLVYDCASEKHVYFSNEFANIKLPDGYFPGITEVNLTRNSREQELKLLSKFMFWECDKIANPNK